LPIRLTIVMTPEQTNKIDAILTEAHKDYEVGLNKRAFFKVSDHMLGEDLVQDTFLKTWKYLVKGGKIDLMKAFLYHILNNLIIDQYRKHKPVSLDSLMKKGFEPMVNDIPKLVNKLDGKMALLLIRRLPIKYQKIMFMRYKQDLTLKEMSDINGQSQNTNAVQLHRGTEMMKDLNKKK